MAETTDDGTRWLPFSLTTLKSTTLKKRHSSRDSATPTTAPTMFVSSTPPIQPSTPPPVDDPFRPAPLRPKLRPESPGERASSTGVRTKAAAFRRSVHENSKSVAYNERTSSPYGSGSPQRAESPRSAPRTPLGTPPLPPPSGGIGYGSSTPRAPPPVAALPKAPTGNVEDVAFAARPRVAPTPPKPPPQPSTPPAAGDVDRARTRSPTSSPSRPARRAESPLRQILRFAQPDEGQAARLDERLYGLPDSADPSTVRKAESRDPGTQHTSTSTYPHISSPIPPLHPAPSNVQPSSLKPSPHLESSLNAAALHMQLRLATRDSTSTASSGAASTISLPNMISRAHTVPVGKSLSHATSLTSLRADKTGILGGASGSGSTSRPGSIRSVRTTASARSAKSRTGGHSRKNSGQSVDSRLTRKLKGNHSRYSMVSSVRVGLLAEQQAAQKAAAAAAGVANKRISGDYGVNKSSKQETPGKKKKKGETMSMLLEDGFFPIEEIVYGTAKETAKSKARYSSMAGFKFNMPPRLSFVEGELALCGQLAEEDEEDDDVVVGPPPSRRRSKARNSRRYGGRVSKMMLSQIEEGDAPDHAEAARRKSSSSGQRVSSGGGAVLNAIPEGLITGDNSRRPSSATTIVATHIKLRGGSVVTVSTPELSAWTLTVYLHGPIKLPKPTIMPRKNSVATLDPFQDAIDRVYQEALAIPRRRSDDAVVDEICDFFDDYGYDVLRFKDNEFWFAGECEEDMDADEMSAEDLLTPPVESMMPTPVEMMLANGVGKANGWPNEKVPPIENEETLRARGKARLWRKSADSSLEKAASAFATRRKSSAVVGNVFMAEAMKQRHMSAASATLPLLPAPETTMLAPLVTHAMSQDASYNRAPQRSELSRTASFSRSPQRSELSRTPSDNEQALRPSPSMTRRKPMDGASTSHTLISGEVLELDASPTWVGPGAASASAVRAPSIASRAEEGQSIKTNRKGLSRMRKFVASAQSMLGSAEAGDKQ
ncbi:unnamed protein product [Zymoseptoria tritici ST99CH_1E4]|uniref:Uncharacterized protein n=1 Tax=Zymoseptoria tritici ST99CH_1E4 TaxID=1276532 RepID=A0A2H1FN32_ZYMTR|nr:unnamed protein product [Zymoseptoria tritici ST99CH_1E4]